MSENSMYDARGFALKHGVIGLFEEYSVLFSIPPSLREKSARQVLCSRFDREQFEKTFLNFRSKSIGLPLEKRNAYDVLIESLRRDIIDYSRSEDGHHCIFPPFYT